MNKDLVEQLRTNMYLNRTNKHKMNNFMYEANSKNHLYKRYKKSLRNQPKVTESRNSNSEELNGVKWSKNNNVILN